MIPNDKLIPVGMAAALTAFAVYCFFKMMNNTAFTVAGIIAVMFAIVMWGNVFAGEGTNE